MKTRALILVLFIVLVIISTITAILPLMALREATNLTSAVLAQTADNPAASLPSPRVAAAIPRDNPSPASILKTNDPYLDRQWALSKIPSLPLSQYQYPGQIVVAVLDTGIDDSHEDLCGKVLSSQNFSDSSSLSDLNGHGTHVAGIIAAHADNSIGISGAAPDVSLLNVKVAEDNGLVWASNVAQGITWAVDHGARVINMSLAAPSKLAVLEAAVQYAWGKGVVLVAAAGNYSGGFTYPAAIAEVIAVAALNPDGSVWSDSNNGEFIDAYAPGVNIYSTLPGNRYGYYNGSSMSAAYVSALAARAFNVVEDKDGDGLLNREVVELVTTLFARP